jgi:hypothetical protein
LLIKHKIELSDIFLTVWLTGAEPQAKRPVEPALACLLPEEIHPCKGA